MEVLDKFQREAISLTFQCRVDFCMDSAQYLYLKTNVMSTVLLNPGIEG